MDRQLAVFGKGGRHIVADRVPQPQEFHVVVLDEADAAQVVQFGLPKAQAAQMVDLRVDLRKHFRRKDHPGVAAFEMILADQAGMLVEDHLVHVEFVQIRVQQ